MSFSYLSICAYWPTLLVEGLEPFEARAHKLTLFTATRNNTISSSVPRTEIRLHRQLAFHDCSCLKLCLKSLSQGYTTHWSTLDVDAKTQ